MGGKTDMVMGRFEEAAGVLIGNDRLREIGKADQTLGQAEQAAEKGVAQAKQAARKVVDEAKATARVAVNEAKAVAQKAGAKATGTS